MCIRNRGREKGREKKRKVIKRVIWTYFIWHQVCEGFQEVGGGKFLEH